MLSEGKKRQLWTCVKDEDFGVKARNKERVFKRAL